MMSEWSYRIEGIFSPSPGVIHRLLVWGEGDANGGGNADSLQRAYV